MYIINNKLSHKNYQQFEKSMRILFTIILSCFIVFDLSSTYIAFIGGQEDHEVLSMVIFVVSMWIPNYILITTLVILLVYMHKYHNYEMNFVKCSMILFVLFEQFDLGLFTTGQMLFRDLADHLIIPMQLYAGGYVLIQSLGIIYVKKSRDAIDGISKIRFLQLYSIYQFPNQEFMQNVYEEMEWRNLTREQKDDFKRLFLENSADVTPSPNENP